MLDLDESIYVYTVKSNPNFISLQSYNSAGIYIKNERLEKQTYSFKDYVGQDHYHRTKKETHSLTAKQIVSNNPRLHKVSLDSFQTKFSL